MTNASTSRQYYLAQLAFWGGYFLLNVFIFSFSNPLSTLLVVIFGLLSALLFIVTHVLRELYRKVAHRWSFASVVLNLIWILPVLALLIQFLLITIVGLGIKVFSIDTGSMQKESMGVFLLYVADTCIMLVLWCAIYLMKAQIKARRQAEVAHWRLQAEVKESELQFLRGQINSHFLFNALNNLRSLIREDGERARSGLNDLATLLRGLLQIDSVKKVKLKEELEWVKGYLALEALQFENRLRTEFNIDSQLLDQELPPMILQTLVENAVKHGIAARREGGTIQVTARKLNGQCWQLCVTNPGSEHPSRHAGNGIGLSNARQRLVLAYGDQATLTLDFSECVTACVELPL